MTTQVALLFEDGIQKDWSPEGHEVAPSSNDSEATVDDTPAVAGSEKQQAKYGTKASRERSAGEAVLADYLSRLSHLPLLTGEEERSLAREFHKAEEQAWCVLLQDEQVINILGTHACHGWSRFRDGDILVRMQRRLKRTKAH